MTDCTNIGWQVLLCPDIRQSNRKSDLSYESDFCTIICDCLDSCSWLTVTRNVGAVVPNLSGSWPLRMSPLVTPHHRLWPSAACMLCGMDGRDGKNSCEHSRKIHVKTKILCIDNVVWYPFNCLVLIASNSFLADGRHPYCFKLCHPSQCRLGQKTASSICLCAVRKKRAHQTSVACSSFHNTPDLWSHCFCLLHSTLDSNC